MYLYSMDLIKLETVVVDNGLGGAVLCTEEDAIVSGEVVLMQRSYGNVEGYLVEETRFTRLIDDIGHMIMHEFRPGRILPGTIVMKQRTSFAPGYCKMGGRGNKLLRDSNGNPVWGRTYYTEDEEDRDELIVDSTSL